MYIKVWDISVGHKEMKDKNKVSPRDIPKLPNGTHTLEPNFFVKVRGNSASYFVRVQRDGKRSDITIGSTRQVTYPIAKAKAQEILSQIALGVDVLAQREAERMERKELEGIPRFKDFYLEAVDNRKGVKLWKSQKHHDQWVATLETYALPVIGKKKLNDITRNDILRILRPIWKEKHETATRLATRLEIVMQHSIYLGHSKEPNPARWKNNLDQVLPHGKNFYTETHHGRITQEEAQILAKKFYNSPHMGHKVTLFGLLTALRVSEFVKARWEEIDFEKKIFSVPPERRKDGIKFPHRVPLSDQAIKLLQSIERTSVFVFPSKQTGKTLSLETPAKTLKDNVYRKDVTAHGCRSIFKDWATENRYDGKLSEKALMHSLGNKVVVAYLQADLLEQRRPMMQAWADFLLEDRKKPSLEDEGEELPKD